MAIIEDIVKKRCLVALVEIVRIVRYLAYNLRPIRDADYRLNRTNCGTYRTNFLSACRQVRARQLQPCRHSN